MSRIWHVESRRIYFHRLSLDADTLRWYHLPTFRCIIGTETFIREIHLHSSSESRFSWTSLATIARIISRYTSLKVLLISSASWQLRSDPPSSLDWTRPRPKITLPSVKRVTLTYAGQIPSHDNLSAFLHWFPALEELELLKSPIPQNSESVINDTSPIPQPNFQFLIECSPTRQTKSYKASLRHRSASLFTASFTAKTVALDFDSSEHIKAAARILYDLGTSLQHLIIRMPRGWAAYESQLYPLSYPVSVLIPV